MKTVCTALLSAVCVGVYRVAIAHRRRYRYGGRARRAGDENGGFRGASGRREHFVGRGLNARSRGRDAQGNDRDLRAACGGGDLPAAVLTLGVRFFVYKLTAAVCECVADKRFSELISNLGTAFALLLAINGAGAMMLFLSLYSLIQTVV